jgi:hypothetical protein
MIYLDKKAIIPESKLRKYLLIKLPKDDKSEFLAKAGYTLDNWHKLAEDLRTQILILPAIATIKTEFGQKYEISGDLTGVNGVILKVTTVWLKTSHETRFITLVPQSKKTRSKNGNSN